MSTVGDRVKEIIVEHLGVDSSKVVDTASFADDLGTDSLDLVEMVMKFETEFGVEIPERAASEITTIKSAIEYIENAQKSA